MNHTSQKQVKPPALARLACFLFSQLFRDGSRACHGVLLTCSRPANRAGNPRTRSAAVVDGRQGRKEQGGACSAVMAPSALSTGTPHPAHTACLILTGGALVYVVAISCDPVSNWITAYCYPIPPPPLVVSLKLDIPAIKCWKISTTRSAAVGVGRQNGLEAGGACRAVVSPRTGSLHTLP